MLILSEKARSEQHQQTKNSSSHIYYILLLQVLCVFFLDPINLLTLPDSLWRAYSKCNLTYTKYLIAFDMLIKPVVKD
jgi:hypothetical protein